MSRETKLGLIVIGLIAFLSASHYLLGNTAEGIYLFTHPWEANKTGAEPMLPAYTELPEPYGPEDAPIKVEVYMQGGDQCHAPTIDMMKRAEEKYPGQLRVIFYDTRKPEIAQEALERKVSCEVGIFLNGENTVRVPGRGKYGVLTFQGPPGHSGYTPDDLFAAIEYMLEKKGIDVAALKAQAASPAANEAAANQQ